MESLPILSPIQGLTTVILAVRGMVDGWFTRGLLGDALMWLLLKRLSLIRVKMEALAARFEAGTLRPRRARAAMAERVAPKGVRTAPVSRQVWPRRFAWLVRLGGWQVAGRGSQLRATLETPEMVALLIAAPQAARILRPLCWMLAVETSVLRPRPAGYVAEIVPAKIAVVAKERVRRPRPVVDWGRIPLPRGVLAAARRQGFGKVPPQEVD